MLTRYENVNIAHGQRSNYLNMLLINIHGFQILHVCTMMITLLQVIIMMIYANVENVDITLFNNQWLRIHMNSKQALRQP